MRFSKVLGLALSTLLGSANLPALDPGPRYRDPGAAGKAGSKPQNGQNGHQNGHQNGNGQNTTDSEIAKYQAMLGKVGPEARALREQAIESLFSMREQKAHDVLREYVVPGADPDGVRAAVLGRLPLRLRNPHDQVFNQGPNQALFRRSYVGKLVEHFAPGRKLLDGETTASADRLRQLARAALLALDTKDRRESFQKLVDSRSVVVRRATLRAAGECQDFDHAPLIAAHLDSDELRVSARAALFDLTFVDFRDRASFDPWFAANKNRTYLELAEAAARAMRQQLNDSTKALNGLVQSTVVKHIEVLAISTLADKWKRIHAEVFPKDLTDESAALQRACLAKLRDVLAAAEPVAGGADAADRLAFHEALTKELAAAPAPTEHALLLEVASYTCAVTETRQRNEQQARLMKGLDHPAVQVQLGALRGLRRFFSPEIRGRVVAIAQQARAARQTDILKAAVETLKSPGFHAPDPQAADLQQWAVVLHGILGDDTLSETVRVDVIEVLCLSDSKGQKVDRAFDLLLEEVGRPAAPATLRQRMMLSLTQLLPNETEPRNKAAKTMLERFVALQVDAVDPKIRLSAASQLVVPEKLSKDQQQALGNHLARAIGARLLEERDEQVFRELVRVLTLQIEVDEPLVSVVNTRLRRALKEFGAKEESKNLAREVVEALRQVALKKGRTILEWAKTCESLLAQRDRTTIRKILAYHLSQDARQLADQPRELQDRVWKLVIQTAALAPKDLRWSGPGNSGEAALVNRAFEALIKNGTYAKEAAVLDTATNRLTHLRCLDAVATDAALTARAEAWLQPADKVLTGTDREEAQLLLAKGYLDQSKPLEAWNRSAMQNIKGAMLEPRLELQLLIANTLQRQNKPADAVRLLADIEANTEKDAPQYWQRLRTYILARYNLDQKQAGALLNEINAWIAATSPKLDSAETKELLALKNQLKGGAKPPK